MSSQRSPSRPRLLGGLLYNTGPGWSSPGPSPPRPIAGWVNSNSSLARSRLRMYQQLRRERGSLKPHRTKHYGCQTPRRCGHAGRPKHSDSSPRSWDVADRAWPEDRRHISVGAEIRERNQSNWKRPAVQDCIHFRGAHHGLLRGNARNRTRGCGAVARRHAGRTLCSTIAAVVLCRREHGPAALPSRACRAVSRRPRSRAARLRPPARRERSPEGESAHVRRGPAHRSQDRQA